MDKVLPYTSEEGGFFNDPSVLKPPVGKKIILLTSTGTCVIGCWQVGMIGWRPLPKATPEQKTIINQGGFSHVSN